jgi:hypothetical protein
MRSAAASPKPPDRFTTPSQIAFGLGVKKRQRTSGKPLTALYGSLVGTTRTLGSTDWSHSTRFAVDGASLRRDDALHMLIVGPGRRQMADHLRHHRDVDDEQLLEVMRQARELWGEGIEPTAPNLHAAAVGLAAQWYRNTVTVEHDVHAEGPWRDGDMLRNNAKVTALCLKALTALATNGVNDVLERLIGLQEEISEILPTEATRKALLEEKPSAPYVLADWIRVNGLGNALSFVTSSFLYPSTWWGARGYEAIVDAYCALDPHPPEPETFRDRMLRAPWELTDDQADFVCEHRYDVRSPS